MNKQNEGRIVLHYDITLACNNRCSYCYCLDQLDNKKVFNEEVFEQVITACNNLKNAKIDLLGGDPLIIYKKLIEFVERTNLDAYQIVSNFNFKPDSKRMNTFREFMKNQTNVNISASWHDDNNEEYFKENVLSINNVMVVLLIKDDNIDKVYEQMLFLEKHNIPFCTEFVYLEETLFTDKDNNKLEKIINHPLFKADLNYIDDELKTHADVIREDLLNIAKQYKTICELSQIKINYDGSLSTICNNPYQIGHLKDGIPLKQIYCRQYWCRCSTLNYKKLI
jgi:organic radical activating enzyme